jgi:hypothetical protein
MAREAKIKANLDLANLIREAKIKAKFEETKARILTEGFDQQTDPMQEAFNNFKDNCRMS